MKLEEIADLKPETGEVLVRVKAVGVNPVEVIYSQRDIWDVTCLTVHTRK